MVAGGSSANGAFSCGGAICRAIPHEPLLRMLREHLGKNRVHRLLRRLKTDLLIDGQLLFKFGDGDPAARQKCVLQPGVLSESESLACVLNSALLEGDQPPARQGVGIVAQGLAESLAQYVDGLFEFLEPVEHGCAR
jgi:hypothetical protein